MDDPAVPATLMPSPTLLLLNNSQSGVRALRENRPSCGESDDAATYNNTIEMLHFLSKPVNPF